MGRATLGITRFELPKFDRGYFPNKDFEDVPDGGSSDCKHVIFNRSSLRPMYGMDRINSSAAAQTRGQGVHYLNVAGATKRSFTFGTAFYEESSGTLTDRTGAVTITDGASNQVQAINWQQGSNKYAIYANGLNPPWKWTGSGNASVLGGSPPGNFTSIASYHGIVFGSIAEIAYFANSFDPETWNSTRDLLTYDKTITCLIDNDQKLAVFMDDHVGSAQGFDYLDMNKEIYEIDKVGCVGRLAATKAFFGKGNTPVIATISRDGIYIIDQAFGAERLLGENYFEEFNQANISKSVLAYSKRDNLLFAAMPYDDATENDYLIVVDMISGAFWPCPDIHANSIRSMASMKDDNGNEFVYFIDTAGYAFKFNRTTRNYHTGTAAQAIDARFKSKRFDLKDIHQLRSPEMLADADGNWNVSVAINFGIGSGDGDTGYVNLLGEGDRLDIDFILDASTLSGYLYAFEVVSGLGGFGRFVSVTFSHSTVDETFNIKKMELQLKRRRMGSCDK